MIFFTKNIFFANFLRIFWLRTLKIAVSVLASIIFLRIIFILNKDITLVQISDKFDYGVSASLNMRIMGHLMSQAILAFLGVQGWGGGGSGRVVLNDNGRVYQSKAADALVQVKTTKFGTNVGLNMLLNISSRYLGGLFWSWQLRGLPSSDGYFWHWSWNGQQ